MSSDDSGSEFVVSDEEESEDDYFDDDVVESDEELAESSPVQANRKRALPSSTKPTSFSIKRGKHSSNSRDPSTYTPSWTSNTPVSRESRLGDYWSKVVSAEHQRPKSYISEKFSCRGRSGTPHQRRSGSKMASQESSDDLDGFIVDDDVIEYERFSDDEEEAVLTSTEVSLDTAFSPVKTTKPPCRYGSKCYRRNPSHHARFSHPPDTATAPHRRPGLHGEGSPHLMEISPDSEEETIALPLEVSEEEAHSTSEAEEAEEAEEGDVVETKQQRWERQVNGILDQCFAHSKRLRERLAQLKEAQDAAHLPRAAESSVVDVVSQPSMCGERTLRPFQLVGLNWLVMLYRVQQNGILADEMGLGKTVQTSSLLASLHEQGVAVRALVVVPASTLMNWKRELGEWAPELSVMVYYGKERDELRHQFLQNPHRYHVLLTTYDYTFRKADKKFLHKQHFTYLILDEAQNIKNVDSLRHRRLFGIDAERRLLLTGTPLQNNLEELFALLYFLIPSLFASLSRFKEMRNKLARMCKGVAVEKLTILGRIKECLAPFVLRRLKSEVALKLPRKIEKVVLCPMTDMQSGLMEKFIAHSRSTYASDANDGGDGGGDGRRKGGHLLSNILMQMRKLANHPLLTRSLYTDEQVAKVAHILHQGDAGYQSLNPAHLVEDLLMHSDFELAQIADSTHLLESHRLTNEQVFDCSGKLRKLKKLLALVRKEGGRTIIFSQMTRVLDILEPFLMSLGHRFLRLDGNTPIEERLELLDEFERDEEIMVFLLSTGAGGVGINLTACNTVIFYDVSFNPQVDRQAMDRVHRLGQKREVAVYKLVTPYSIEEHIHTMAMEKQALSNAVLEEGIFGDDEAARKVQQDILSSVVSKALHV